MTRSPDSVVPSAGGRPKAEKRDDKGSMRRQGAEANSRAATPVNAIAASSTLPASTSTQLELFPGRAPLLRAKPATIRRKARKRSVRRDGVQGGGTRRQSTRITGETLFGPTEGVQLTLPSLGREAHKGRTRKRRNDAVQGVGGGHSTGEPRDNRGEGRTATSTKRPMQGKAAGLPPQGKAQPRSKSANTRMESARKLRRTLYRAAKAQPTRRFSLLYDKVLRYDVLEDAWKRVKSKNGAAGVDQVDVESVKAYGEKRFLEDIQHELRTGTYRASHVRRVHIPKPGQSDQTRPLGIPTLKDRTVQMVVKLVIEPLFEADFRSCSFGFRPKKTARMALSAILEAINAGYR